MNLRKYGSWLLLMLSALAAFGLRRTGTPGSALRSNTASGTKSSVLRAALPLSFEVNRGQADGRVKFLAHGEGYGLFLTPSGLAIALQAPAIGARRPADAAMSPVRRPTRKPAVVNMKFVGAANGAVVVGD